MTLMSTYLLSAGDWKSAGRMNTETPNHAPDCVKTQNSREKGHGKSFAPSRNCNLRQIRESIFRSFEAIAIFCPRCRKSYTQ